MPTINSSLGDAKPKLLDWQRSMSAAGNVHSNDTLPFEKKAPVKETMAHTMDVATDQKVRKFGSFMGKILLLGKKGKHSSVDPSKTTNSNTQTKHQSKPLTQRILTEEPYVDFFRMRRSRLEPKTAQESHQRPTLEKTLPLTDAGQATCQTSAEVAVLHSPNKGAGKTVVEQPLEHRTAIPKFHIRNGRKTRWDLESTSTDRASSTNEDIVENSIVKQGGAQPSQKKTMAKEHPGGESPNDASTDIHTVEDENDDLSSIDSLQSDDDVLGPWIELGLINDPKADLSKLSANNMHLDSNTTFCENCSCLASKRNALERINFCKQCRTDFDESFIHFSDMYTASNAQLSTLANNTKTVKPVKKGKISTGQPLKNTETKAKQGVNRNTTTIPPSKNRRSTTVLIPPTKSLHSENTDRKINAAKKKRLSMNSMSTWKARNSAEMITKEKISDTACHVTTGAFLTRKTAQILADPEHGFYPNPYGYYHHQKMEVLNLNGHWYPGVLEQMDKGKVKIRYLDWDQQEEWIIMGSRRLRKSDESSTPTFAKTQVGPHVNIDGQTDFHTPETATVCKSLLNSVLSAPKLADDTDYVNDTMDKDRKQIFNNNEIFMTRRLARMMCDEYGFRPNSFGYRRNRAVAVTYQAKGKGGRYHKEACLGYLREMQEDRVRVYYLDLQCSEWVICGSRRLRVLTEEEEAQLPQLEELFKKMDEADSRASSSNANPTDSRSNKRQLDEHSETVKQTRPTLATSSTKRVSKSNTNRKESNLKKPAGKTIKADKETQGLIEANVTVDTTPGSSSTETFESAYDSDVIATSQTSKMGKEEKYITTGAFATRTAMRQLQDKNGFVPNPYGYTNNMLVEVLNTKSGKAKFWERARLVAMRPGQVKVHYEGWADVYDEWLMLGSRRIRTAMIDDNSSCGHEADVADCVMTEDVGRKSPCANDLPFTSRRNIVNDLLITEENPELFDEMKRKVRHKVVRPEDYQKMGLLADLNELAAKQAKKRDLKEKRSTQPCPQKRQRADKAGKYINKSAKEDDSGSTNENETVSNSKTKRRRRRFSAKLEDVEKGSQPNSKQNSDDEPSQDVDKTQLQSTFEENGKIITSLRLLQAKALESNSFVANIYGYDYMQHVTVLSGDKKIYEGRLVSMNKSKVRVHFCGWPDMFDEYITLGSRRIQLIANDHEVQCIEPNYRDRYEAQLINSPPTSCFKTHNHNLNALERKKVYINRHTRKRLTLNDSSANDQEEDEPNVEYHKETVEEDEEVVEIDSWKVYCNQCNVVIKQFRYYCTYCETPSAGFDYQSFELCLQCFDQNFPVWHEHPRSSFAVQSVINTEVGPRPIKGELVTIWEEDILDESNSFAAIGSETSNVKTGAPNHDNCDVNEENALEASKVFTGDKALAQDEGYQYLKKWRHRKVCAFCNDDDDTSTELGKFIGPFITATFNKNGVEKKRTFWAHDSCARYSPEVFCTPEGKWYNVTLALRRGRGMRCYECKEKGATIGCFESKCTRSFHLSCAQKPISNFKNGVIFWCKSHEAYYNKKDTYVNIFSCDGCKKQMENESWFTCVSCASYFSSFDLCSTCYGNFPTDHIHAEDEFEETSFAIMKEMEAQKATDKAREKERIKANNAKRKKRALFPRRKKKLSDGSTPISCCYCGTYEAESWRTGYDGGVIMCNKCFDLATLIDNDGRSSTEEAPVVFRYDIREASMQTEQRYVASIEDYSHKPYLTREALSAKKFNQTNSGLRLSTYEPQPYQLFSLTFDSTYFDIPGRAPRWATHSGTDYHGTWLPQTVRRAILKHTIKNERVLSTFLGRGTDAIECFLLQRKCCGVDINPAAVTLSQKNCSFEVPPGLTSAEYRPIIAQADSRCLTGALFTNESYHHILSHPPYKDCVAYSTHLDGDLSRFTSLDDFKIEYSKVVNESWRLLKMGRRLTLGIGDNREHCFYIPVSFSLMRLYIDQGFELEELIVKRQRYCSAFGLGTYLCVQFDFLVFTHEFIATFRKVPKENIDRMAIKYDDIDHNNVTIRRCVRGVPPSAVMRKSVVMGTVWIFKPKKEYSFQQLCLSRMVERFGKDEGNWEHIELVFKDQTVNQAVVKSLKSEDIEQKEENSDTSEIATEQDSSLLSEYEQERQKNIQENNATLLKLGLISELSEESEDVVHFDTMINREAYDTSELVLMVMHHEENLSPKDINAYRKTIVQIAKEARSKLAEKGMLIIGTKDVRDPISGKLWPLSMLVLEDIENEVGRDSLKLKEMVVTVPDGYSKDRQKVVDEEEQKNEDDNEFIDIETIQDDNLPIVHAVYLIFQKI